MTKRVAVSTSTTSRNSPTVCLGLSHLLPSCNFLRAAARLLGGKSIRTPNLLNVVEQVITKRVSCRFEVDLHLKSSLCLLTWSISILLICAPWPRPWSRRAPLSTPPRTGFFTTSITQDTNAKTFAGSYSVSTPSP